MNFTNRKVFSNSNVAVPVFLAALLVILILFIVFTRVFQSDNNAVVNAFANLAAQDTFHTKSQLVINLPERLGNRARPFTKVDIDVEGDVKRTDDNTPELTGTLSAEARGRGNAFFIDGETRLLKDTVIFRLSEFPTLLNPSGSLVDKWTYVDVPLLTTSNSDEVGEALLAIGKSAKSEGAVTVDGERLDKYSVSLSDEEQQQLAGILTLENSGNRGLNTIARLLKANKLESLNIFLNKNQELSRIEAHFIRPLSNGDTFDFATLTLTFSDYGKDVAIDLPQKQVTVKPEVFSKLFGTGDVAPVVQ